MVSGEERRKYPRYGIRLAAQIAPVSGGGAMACEIRDYCSGGMLVQDGGSTRQALRVGDPVELRTSLLTPQGAKRVRIKAKVVWAQPDCLGVEFPRPVQAVVEMLQQHTHLTRGKDATAAGAGPTGPSEARCLAKLRHVAQGALPALMDELLSRVSTALVEQADHISTNLDRQHHYEGMAAFESFRRAGSQALVQRLTKLALDEQSGAAPGAARSEPEPDESGLALVDTEDFERWLESSKFAMHLEEHFRNVLRDLEARLAAQRARLSGTLREVPFNPGQFGAVLKEVATELDLATPARQVLFGVAEELLFERLGGFYGELQSAMQQLGMQPLPPAMSRQAAPPRYPDGGAEGPQADRPGPGDASGAAPAGPATAPQAMPPDYPAQRQALARELLGRVAETPELAGTLADWLAPLQQPLARAAVADEAFFFDSQHPLRAIVDLLGHLQSLRTRGTDDTFEDALGQAVATLLQPLAGGTADEAQYRAVAEGIEELVDRESHRYQRNVERVVAASVGRDRVRQVRNVVADELNRRYAGKTVPELLPYILLHGYRAMLEWTLLRTDEDKSAYVDRLRLLDGLVALLGGDAWHAESAATQPEQLLSDLRGDLASASFDPVRRTQIEAWLRAALRDPQRAARTRMPTLPREDGEDATRPPHGVSEKAWASVLDRVGELAVGDRVVMRGKPGGPQELRVAWIRDDGRRFTLVDKRGLRARDLELAELAEAALTGQADFERPDGRPLTERATDAMLAQMEEQLAHQAAHDSLTGLPGRPQFKATFERAFGNGGEPGILMWIDLDQFRLVNELHGYDTGDRLLVATARLLEERFGDDPVLGHLGGDRFAVLLAGADAAQGERRANSACSWVAGLHFDWQGRPMALTASIGVVDLAEFTDSAAAMRAAEAAVIAAKASGGNQAYRYRADDPTITRRQESVHWIAQVDEALDRGRLRLRCQPIVPVRPDPKLKAHFEVLLGIEDGQGQALAIGDFISAAESYKRMLAVDRWVVRTVIDWVDAHRARMDELHQFAVNLSGQTVDDPAFVDYVRELLQRKHIEPSWISFEVTETAAIADLGRAVGVIADLKALGCSIALDDFGSGLASYSYLKELPIDVLKIDGVFVRNIATDANDYAVVRSINEIGHFMGKKTIAEFVVNDDVLRRIRTIGVDYGQGFGIGEPSLLDDLVKPRHGDRKLEVGG